MNEIIAIDPGKKTGAVFKGPLSTGFYEGPLLAIASAVMEYLLKGHRPVIVIEDYIYTTETAKKSRQTWSTEGIGMFRLIADMYDLEFVVQAPASAKKFSTDDKLKTMNWYNPSPGGHQNDAARHLLLYCVNQKLIDPRIFI